jgi:hypothetical protein
VVVIETAWWAGLLLCMGSRCGVIFIRPLSSRDRRRHEFDWPRAAYGCCTRLIEIEKRFQNLVDTAGFETDLSFPKEFCERSVGASRCHRESPYWPS